ncbi:MAG: ATP-binding protein [Beijerinckiaceae bacterium]
MTEVAKPETIAADASATNIEIDRLATRRISAFLGMVLVTLALLSAVATFLTLAGFVPTLFGERTLVVLFAINFILIALLMIVVAREGFALWRAKRSGAAGAKLHSRIMRWFSFVATFPAIVMALVAYVTLDRGLEPWFSSTVRDVITGSSEIAKAYTESQCRTMTREIGLMAGDLDRAKPMFEQDRDLFRRFLTSRANYLEFPITMLVNKDQSLIERIETAKIGEVAGPTAQEIEAAGDGEPWCMVPQEGNVFRVIFKLTAYDNVFLYGARPVDPRAIEFPRIADAGLTYYRVLEERKGALQIAFATMYALVALIVLLSAAWLGLNFANRLVAPIRRLIAATDRVASGQYAVAVPVRTSDGDLAHLGQTFNKMTAELQRQHERLTAAADIIDQRRRFTEAVLSGVSAGVIGIDPQGTITLVNPSAEKLLGGQAQNLVGAQLETIEPKLAAIAAQPVPARSGRQTQHHVSLIRDGREQLLNVRLTTDQSNEAEHGLIMTLDDITDLITAQRTSAWADVARRIAHEIKNPLTPIQLSVERIRRKYGKNIGEDRQVFDQCTDTIIRQVDGIKKMVDEFSSFARMPKPAPESDDIADMVREVVFLMRVGYPDIEMDNDIPDGKVIARFDRRLLGQAVTNIIKNATESIAAVDPAVRGPGKIAITLREDKATETAIIDVTDNGVGFPAENRQRLLEPYMTTRSTGTGLGLAIVGKILEDHGGGIELLDNPAGRGARVRMRISTNAADNAADNDSAGVRLPDTGTELRQ